MPVVVGLGSGIAVFQGMFYYLGGRFDTFKKEEDEFARKETLRRTTRLPIEQTVSEIGEGRGKSRTPSPHAPSSSANFLQESDLPVMRSDEPSDSRRSTGSRSTQLTQLLRAVYKQHDARANGG